MNDSKDHKAAAEPPLDCRVMRGDRLEPIPLWNKTERPENHLVTPTEILDVMTGQSCESGIMLRVATKNGRERWLDSGWFVAHNAIELTGDA